MDSLRIDRWLCFARLVKTRSRAAALCAEGAVAVNGVVVLKPSHALRAGDVVVLPAGRRRWRAVRVLGFADRRGPFAEASLMYEEAEAPAAAVAALEGEAESCEEERRF